MTSTGGFVRLGDPTIPVFYLGWSTLPKWVGERGHGEESFGLSLGRLYLGCYTGTGWCFGFLNRSGCLPE